PGERELRGGAALCSCHRLESLVQMQIPLQVLALESRKLPAHVVRGERRRVADGAAEKSAAERAERDEPDSELAACGKDGALGIARPQRVLALHRRDRMRLLRAAQRRR